MTRLKKAAVCVCATVALLLFTNVESASAYSFHADINRLYIDYSAASNPDGSGYNSSCYVDTENGYIFGYAFAKMAFDHFPCVRGQLYVVWLDSAGSVHYASNVYMPTGTGYGVYFQSTSQYPGNIIGGHFEVVDTSCFCNIDWSTNIF